MSNAQEEQLGNHVIYDAEEVDLDNLNRGKDPSITTAAIDELLRSTPSPFFLEDSSDELTAEEISELERDLDFRDDLRWCEIIVYH